MVLTKIAIKIIQGIYIRWGWRPFFSTNETTFQFCFQKILYRVKSMRWRAILAYIQSTCLTAFCISAGNNSLRKFWQKFSLTLIILLFTKNGLVTPYHEIPANTMTFFWHLVCRTKYIFIRDIWFLSLPQTWSFFRLTGTSRVKSFSSCQNVFYSIIRMLLSNLSLRKPVRVSLLFQVPSLICGVLKCLNCLRFLFFIILRIDDRLIPVWSAIFLGAKCV